jgi:hypothetical protein
MRRVLIRLVEHSPTCFRVRLCEQMEIRALYAMNHATRATSSLGHLREECGKVMPQPKLKFCGGDFG